jgi:hypothetical protein
MKLEDQVVSLELAKEMKDLGFEKESLFEWVKLRFGNGTFQIAPVLIPIDTKSDIEFMCKAYTVAELGEMLPEMSSSYKGVDDCWRCNDGSDEDYMIAKTEADAKAKMLIYLKKNNLL